MPLCRQCGQENPEGFRFCGGCGAALTAAAAPREVRKTVTFLFCDVTGSTALGERLDPETLRRVMRRYFDEISGVIERHGGTVEKFVGDAVMAVFGIPRVREDDALRAVRAATEIRDALPSVARELGVKLAFRTGVNTGEVMAGDGQTLATGDAVNVAARLEQAAAPGEILIGSQTLRLVRDAVDAESVDPLEAAGQGRATARPSAARRAPRRRRHRAQMRHIADRPRAGDAAAPGRLRAGRRRAPLLPLHAARCCRHREIAARSASSCSGSPAKAPSFAGAACPTARASRSGRSRDPDPARPGGRRGARRTSPRAGPARRASSSSRCVACSRRLRASGPLIVVLDDLHWAEPTLLDLLDHIADLSRDAPSCCSASPARSCSKSGRRGPAASSTRRASCSSPCRRTRRGGSSSSSPRASTRRRARASWRRARATRCFSRRWSRCDSRGAERVPPTIQALLAARLDRLAEPERAVIERGSVEGKVFHRRAIRDLAPQALGEASTRTSPRSSARS